MASLAEVEEDLDCNSEQLTIGSCSIQNHRRNSSLPFFAACRRQIKLKRKLIALLLYLAYFAYAVLRCLFVECPPVDNDRWALIILTCVISAVTIFYYLFVKLCWPVVYSLMVQNLACLPLARAVVDYLRWSTYGVMLVLYLTFAFVDTVLVRNEPRCLISLGGIAIMLTLCTLSSSSFRRIQPMRLQPIVVGLALHILLAVAVLRCPIGEIFFTWLAKIATTFFDYSNEGATFVWATAFNSKDLVFSVLPIIPFFAAFTSLLFYFDWMQSLIKVVATVMEKVMGTTAPESTTCCANVFVGMAESPLLVHRFLPYMTKSELHAVMTGGFATIAIYMMGTLTKLGIDFKHLLAASVMAGPSALALSKLVFPEIERSSIRAKDVELYSPSFSSMPKSVIEAIYEGASMSISMLGHIVVNLIAIISLKSLVNGLLTWFGERAGLGSSSIGQPFNLEFIASYLFWPLAFLMGVPTTDCLNVGKLLAIKFFANDPVVPFTALGKMVTSRLDHDKYYCQYVHGVGNQSAFPVRFENGSYFLPSNSSTVGPFISPRAESITTYALCGYANMVAVGIQIGAIGALSPASRSTLASLAFRALITATVVNLLNGATAGLLLNYSQPSWNETCSIMNVTD